VPHLALKEVAMPIYEYQCECGQKFIRCRPMSDCKKPAQCEACQQMAKRIIGPCSVHMDYSDMDNFGDERYAEARAKQCGVPT
jgi:putative FmdB family regulatory protein